MSVFYNVLGSQNIAGSIQQDQFYAFTSDTNLNNVRADVTVSLLSWTTGIRTSATDFLTLSRANMQISSDFYSGSEKIDTIFGSNLNDAVLYNNGVISGGFGSFSSIEQIELGAGDDIVDLTAHGTGGLDYGKNITIRAGNGDDIIIGGAGLDTLYGDDGNDLIFGYRGADIIYGGTGDDRLYGDDLGFNGIAGADFLYGEAGDDFLDGGARGDFLSGGEGNDILIGGGGDDSLFGDVGIDTFVYSGNRSDYSIFWDAFNSPYRVTDLRPGSPDGADNVSGAEFLQFADGTIALTGPNNHPVITSNGGGITASIAINENSTSVTTVFATDVDSGQTVTYSILGGPDAALFEINQVTGELSFINAPDFESPADIGMDNVYNLIVQASDGINSDQQQIAVSVGNANESPVITSNGGGATASVNVAENTAAITTVTSTDADGPAPVYTIVGGADAALFTIDPQTGALQFLSAPNFENPSDLNRDNAYDVIVRASDGTDFDQQQITVIVNNVNEFAPQIVSNGGASTASIGVLENINLATTVTAFDIDRGTLTYSIAGGADASLFAIDSVTGALAFISAPDFENPLDAGLDNIYEIIVRASDGELYDEQVLSITIRDVSEVGGVTIVATSGNNTISPTATQFRTTAGNDTIFALAGDDIIDGGAGADRMEGGSGNDVYYVDQFSDDGNSANDDLVIEAAAAGTDRVFSTVSYVLTSNVEELFLQGLNSINGTGNELANKIIGNAGNNVLDGGLGNDTFLGFDGDDILLGGVGNDLLDGGGGYNVLDGGDGNDTLDGRDGVNRLLGGFGDDIYYINDTTDDGDNTNDDLVTEAASAGIDLVYSQWDYVLPANVENLTLLEGLTNNGWGNDLNNLINGNSGNNYLDGGLGNDTLLGNDGADTLSGGSGDDILVGGLGADSHEGGSGNDTYFIDVFSDDGISYNDDKVIELAGGGIDTVNASVNYTLGNEVENLTLTGTLAINGTGTALANTLIGNSAANTILGLDGNDTINGNAGDDVLRGGNGNDTMNGGTENDTLFGDAGTDTLLGGAGNDIIAGGSGSDTLNGQSGLDTLIGGTGRDSMNGGTEADIFKFAFGDTTKVSSTIDVITDFTTGSDKVDLDFVAGGISAASYSEGLITTNSFTEALASAQAMLSGGKSVAFVAGSADGWLFWDTNSDGVIDQSILLKGVTSLGGFDFTDIM